MARNRRTMMSYTRCSLSERSFSSPVGMIAWWSVTFLSWNTLRDFLIFLPRKTCVSSE